MSRCYTKILTPPAVYLFILLASLTSIIDLKHFNQVADKNQEGFTAPTEEQKTTSPDPEHTYQTILENLSGLAEVVVEDIMTPRRNMETLNLSESFTKLCQQITTSYHSRLPVFDESANNIVGILSLKRLLPFITENHFDDNILRSVLTKPYFIPANTSIYTQLQFFQENHQRLGLVVDEYGEILGLITLEDIVEEFIGKFTTSTPNAISSLTWSDEGSIIIDGMQTLRDLNRKLDIDLPLNGPKTLNGLILEHLQDIPEAGLSIKIGKVPIEVLQTEERRIKTVRLFRPVSDV